MQDDWQPESSQRLGATISSAAIALLIHAFVLAMLLAVALSVLGIAEFYEEWELSLKGEVVAILRATRLFQDWWYLLTLPVLLYAALLVWLASSSTGRWLLTWLNYFALGSALMITTITFGVMVRPLMKLIPQ
jgi:hypothetical protein